MKAALRRCDFLPASIPFLYENVFGVSAEKTVFVAPNLTIRVLDSVTGKPLKDARVTVNTSEALTDESGLAVFGELAAGTYTVLVRHGVYKETTKTVTFTPGELITIKLLPYWAIGLGIVSFSAVAVIIGAKLLWRH